MGRCRPLLASAVVLLWASLVEAQNLTGNIIGHVRDESGAVLPGVAATIASTAIPGGPMTVTTNDSGQYRFTQLPPGTYELKVELLGFRTYVEQDLRVSVDATVERNVTLGVGSVAESITVSGQSPVVDPRQTGVRESLGDEALSTMTTNRYGVQGYAMMLPGVSVGNFQGYSSGVNILGSAANGTSIIQDGVVTNSVTGGGGYGFQDLDGNAEMQVEMLAPSAEYQRAQGGVINIVSRAGTNQFRGDGQIYYGPDKLSSQPVKIDCNCPEGQTGFTWLKYRDRGGRIGGPIKKDRLWFYASHTHTGPAWRNPGTPLPPKEFYREFMENRTQQKLTWKVSDKVNFNQFFYYEWWEYLRPTFPTLLIPPEAMGWFPGGIFDASSEVNWTVNSSTVFTGRFTDHYYPNSYTGFGPTLSGYDITTPAHIDALTGVGSKNWATTAQFYEPRQNQVSLKLNTYLSGSRFSQNIRVGYQWTRSANISENVRPGGVLFNDNNGLPDQAQFMSPSIAASRSDAFAVWGENELNIGQRLTIVPGIRFDRMTGVSPPVHGIDGSTLNFRGWGLFTKYVEFEPTGQTIQGLGELFTWSKVSPRVGINLKLDETRTVLRATAGRYFRPISLGDFESLHPGNPPTTTARFNPAACPGATIATVTANCYTTVVSISDPLAGRRIDPNLDAPFTDSYSIGVDREVARSLRASVSYVYKRGLNHISTIDTNESFGTQQVTAPDGSPLTVFPRLSAASARVQLTTNPDGFYDRFSGVVLSLSRRMANRWMGNVSYTYGIARGLTGGANPNSRINNDGRLNQDRPHQFKMFGLYDVPKIDVQLSGNLLLVSGQPYGAQMQVVLPQGRINVLFQPSGAYRQPFQNWLNLRATKSLLRQGSRRIELTAELRNALQEISIGSIATQVFTSPVFGAPTTWAEPRRLVFLAKAYF